MCAQVCYPSGRQQPAIVILLTPVSSLYWSLKILGGIHYAVASRGEVASGCAVMGGLMKRY